jgi:hypothetical protein
MTIGCAVRESSNSAPGGNWLRQSILFERRIEWSLGALFEDSRTAHGDKRVLDAPFDVPRMAQ